jgi:hypothetical protein
LTFELSAPRFGTWALVDDFFRPWEKEIGSFDEINDVLQSLFATAQGSAQEVSPGQTVTVQLVSSDPMIVGRFRY